MLFALYLLAIYFNHFIFLCLLYRKKYA